MKLLPLLLKKSDSLQPPTLPSRMTWSSSSLRLFRRCKRKFYWKYVLRLSSAYRSRHLTVGTALHRCLAEWYSGNRTDMAKIAEGQANEMEKTAIQEKAMYDEEDFSELRAQIDAFIGMSIAYSQIYRQDKTTLKILRTSIEKQFLVDMGNFDFVGKIDLLGKRGKEVFLMDHKSTSRIEDTYIQRLPLDTQMRSYVYSADKGLGIKPNLVIYDIIRKSKLRRKANESVLSFCERIKDDYLSRPSFYFFREELKYSTSDIDAFEFELRQTHQEYLQLIENATDPLDPRAWGINDSECTSFFRLCEYHGLCTIGMDKGNALMFTQRPESEFHPELEETD